jgi:hypothetical protein
MEMKEMRRRESNGRRIRRWQFKKTKMGTSGQLSRVYIQLHTDFKVQLETYINVTNLQGPPSERTPEQKLWDFKTRAQQYARDRESCDDVRISYLEFLETEAEYDLALARMIAG